MDTTTRVYELRSSSFSSTKVQKKVRFTDLLPEEQAAGRGRLSRLVGILHFGRTCGLASLRPDVPTCRIPKRCTLLLMAAL